MCYSISYFYSYVNTANTYPININCKCIMLFPIEVNMVSYRFKCIKQLL